MHCFYQIYYALFELFHTRPQNTIFATREQCQKVPEATPKYTTLYWGLVASSWLARTHLGWQIQGWAYRNPQFEENYVPEMTLILRNLEISHFGHRLVWSAYKYALLITFLRSGVYNLVYQLKCPKRRSNLLLDTMGLGSCINTDKHLDSNLITR